MVVFFFSLLSLSVKVCGLSHLFNQDFICDILVIKERLDLKINADTEQPSPN